MVSKSSLLDLYLYFGVVIFALGKVFNPFFLDFYLYFNLLGAVVLVIYLLGHNTFNLSFIYLFLIGLLFYLIGNLVYIKDLNFGIIKLSDIFFIFQILCKQISITYLSNNISKIEKFKIIFLINLFVIVFTLIGAKYLEINILDLFYFFESFVSMCIILYLNFFTQTIIIDFNFVDLDFFFFGQLLWLTGDIFYSDLISNNSYILGDFSDLIYFIGYYFFLKSIVRLRFGFNYDIVKTYI